MAIIEGGRIIEGSGTGTPLRFSGAPTSGVGGTYAGIAVVGSQLVDVTNGKEYIATAASATSVTWVVVGSQT